MMALKQHGIQLYQRSVSRARTADFIGRITGEQHDLIQYDEVAKRLQARQLVAGGTEWVPLPKIVGSVGRYRDFTRSFLPRANVNQERWARLHEAMNGEYGFPPVELFKIGDAYFVHDGNHRVSVAHANNVSHIEAYVREVQTPIPLTSNDFERDQWILKLEYANFLDETHLDKMRPKHRIALTEPGNYKTLAEHIEVHRYLRNQALVAVDANPLSWDEAVGSWYDTVYLPMAEAIQESNLLDYFPGRTEADLYLWLARHREKLAQEYQLAPLPPQTAVNTFVKLYSGRTLPRLIKDIRLLVYRLIGIAETPLGMDEDAYLEGRIRHDAGELSLEEAANEEQAQASAIEIDFFHQTQLGQVRPTHGIKVGDPEHYAVLYHHIEVHRYFQNLERMHAGEAARLTWIEAVISWYDRVYTPIIQAIRQHKVLTHFPHHTEADLYLLISYHRETLAAEYGLAPLDTEMAVVTFIETHSGKPLERIVKEVRLALFRMLGMTRKPLGISQDEFRALQARHDQGEVSLAEAEQRD